MEITKSNSSYGNWAIRLSATEIRFFFRKTDAIKFLTPHVGA
jgi:hypothetical protein